MRILIAAIGRMRPDPERDHYRHYTSRIRKWTVETREIEPRRRTEAELLLDAAPKGSVIVPLDEGGTELGSEKFADQLGRWQDDGEAQLSFLIGGADGLAKQVLDRGRLILSLGRYTWPHMLARIMLAEQIYRAQQILERHPYHRS
ncbi:MAG: 23S rRNA (pseudouridine(1915)-N(3))-methyltransferase RlmH [Alphaproteobacteria bacterium]|nr:23S rRNA (pseudouridine(1915)-N(3))-methyltransferase RlmH [Alphaproteobacteria bacterium]